jgi:hypothetical protein
MPAHSAAKNQTLSVTTNVGTVNLKNAYNFQNGVSVTPNTAPSSQGIVDVSVTGSNFLTPTFANGGASTSVNGHVYLVDGKYNPKANTGNKTLGPAAECTDVLVFTNTDLICRLQLASSLAADGTFNTATTRSPTDFVTTTSSPTITSATANFTQADVGRLISDAGNTNFTAGSFIKSVTNSTTAVMNINAKTTGTTGITAAIGGNRASVAATASTNGYNLTAGAGSFTSQDIGRRVTVSGGSAAASAGTVIVSVNADGTIATLSRPVAAPADVAGAIVVGDSPVADGAYVFTVVSNGAVDANTTDPNYDQSVVSSASTFTVANY